MSPFLEEIGGAIITVGLAGKLVSLSLASVSMCTTVQQAVFISAFDGD